MPIATEIVPTPDSDNMDKHYTFTTQVIEVIRPDELLLKLDLGFGVHKNQVVSLFRVDCPDPYAKGDSDESSEQMSFVQDWVSGGRKTYAGESDFPFSATTIRPKAGKHYQALVFDRGTGGCLNDHLLTEFPEVSGR
jgi:hypothetical protein